MGTRRKIKLEQIFLAVAVSIETAIGIDFSSDITLLSLSPFANGSMVWLADISRTFAIRLQATPSQVADHMEILFSGEFSSFVHSEL